MFYLYRRSFTTDFLPFALLPLLSGGPIKNLSVLYTKRSKSKYSLYSYLCFLRLVSFLTPLIHITSVARMHRSFCRVITGCLSSTSIPLLHLETLLSPFRVTFTHQCPSFFKSALRLPLSFPLAFLAHHNPRNRLKKGLWRSFSTGITLTTTYNYLVNL